MMRIRTRRHICFVSLVEGNLATPSREKCESDIFNRLIAEGVLISMVGVSDVGCTLALDGDDVLALTKALVFRSRAPRSAMTGVR